MAHQFDYLKDYGVRNYPVAFPHMLNDPKGYFISFEGIDGAGKSNHVKLLKAALETTGFVVKTFRSPGTSGIGEKIREIVKDQNSKICDEAELLLMNADRAQLVQECVRPALEAGEIVICDRYMYSTIVYQGFGRGIDMAMVQATTQYAIGNTVPNLTVVLDIDEIEANRRRDARGVTDRFESEKSAYHSRIRKGFDWLKTKEPESKGKLVCINSSGPEEAVHNEIYRCVAFRIGLMIEGQLRVEKRLIT